jgi:hypothetical protein
VRARECSPLLFGFGCGTLLIEDRSTVLVPPASKE